MNYIIMSEMNVVATFERTIFTFSLWFLKTWARFLSEILIQVLALPACVVMDKFLILSEHLKVEN